MSDRFIYDLPFAAYAKEPGLSGSLLVEGVTSMYRMHYRAKNPKDETPQMRWGRLGHSSLLEPERLERDLAVFDGATKKGNAWDAFKLENEGKEIITEEEATRLAEMIEMVYANPVAKEFLTSCQHEVSMFWDGEYGRGKGRMDGYNPNQINELKFTADVTRFKDTAARMLYHVKCGWYQVGVRALTGKLLPVYVMAVEADPPHDVMLYEYDVDTIAIGRDVAQAVAKQYRECQKTGEYPGVCSDIRTLRLPEWMMAGEKPLALVVGGQSIEL